MCLERNNGKLLERISSLQVENDRLKKLLEENNIDYEEILSAKRRRSGDSFESDVSAVLASECSLDPQQSDLMWARSVIDGGEFWERMFSWWDDRYWRGHIHSDSEGEKRARSRTAEIRRCVLTFFSHLRYCLLEKNKSCFGVKKLTVDASFVRLGSRFS